jgi:hypothetical protein
VQWAKSSGASLRCLSSSIDGLSVPPTISRDKLNNFVSGFGAQDATDVLIVPYEPSEPSRYRRRNYTALSPTVPYRHRDHIS